MILIVGSDILLFKCKSNWELCVVATLKICAQFCVFFMNMSLLKYSCNLLFFRNHGNLSRFQVLEIFESWNLDQIVRKTVLCEVPYWMVLFSWEMVKIKIGCTVTNHDLWMTIYIFLSRVSGTNLCLYHLPTIIISTINLCTYHHIDHITYQIYHHTTYEI